LTLVSQCQETVDHGTSLQPLVRILFESELFY